MGDRLDTLLSCVYGKTKKIFCGEGKNDFAFSLTDELCEKDGMVCILVCNWGIK